jgi:hypothetical protein
MVPVEAAAFDYRALGAVDFLLATDPDFKGVTDAELGLVVTAQIDKLRAGEHNSFSLRLDFHGREGLTGNSTINDLYELNATGHFLDDKLALTIGRFHVPGGFWVIADGARLDVRYADWIGQSFYGGLRSFTTGRRDTWMTADNPTALPLAGTSLWLRHRIVQAWLGFTWAEDGIDLQSQLVSGQRALERHVEDEYFLDGGVTIYPHPTLFLTGGASLGTRYDVQFNVNNPYSQTTVGIATLGAAGAYGLAEYRPLKSLRFSYTFNFERVRLIQSQLLTRKADGTPVQTASGSFQDHTLRLTYRIWKALRMEASYRLRWRENTDVEHHATIGLRGDELWQGLGGFGSVGVDKDSLTAKEHDRLIYSVGVSYVRTFLDLRLGILYTDGFGSGLTFSQHLMTSDKTAPAELFPYVLETNRIAFLRGFFTFWKMFAGLDVEENLSAGQLRMLAQIGGSI